MSGRTCTGCGLKTRCSYGRWPDRHPRVAAAFAGLTGVVNLSDKHRTAAMALVVPGTPVGLAAVATYPVVFVPLIVLFGVALVMVVGHEGTRRNPACWRTDCPAIRKFQQTRATISEQTPYTLHNPHRPPASRQVRALPGGRQISEGGGYSESRAPSVFRQRVFN